MRSIGEWLDQYGAADDLLDERFADQQVVVEEQNHISDTLRAFFPKIPSEEAYRGAQERAHAWGAVRTLDEILSDPHWEDRGYWQEIEHPELGERFRYSGAWAIWSETPLGVTRRAPLTGEHNAEVYAALGLDCGRPRGAGPGRGDLGPGVRLPCGLPRSEGVAPAQAGEATEVRIG